MALGGYTLDARALMLVGACHRPLALAASALGRVYVGAQLSPSVEFYDDEEDDDEEEEDEKSGVALVQIHGPLAQRGLVDLCAVVDGYDLITARLAAALEAAAAVVLVIDSPGGDGAGLEEGVRRMRALVEASGKPVLAYVDEMAASAAYWIAAGVADAIYLPAAGEVGSIGAIAVHVDESAAAEKEGYRYTLIREPAGKAAGSGLEPLGEVGRARIERAVSDLATRFVASVAARRGVSESALRALDADMVTGAAAVTAKLADGVATLEEVIALAAAEAARRESDMKLKAAIAQILRMPADASDEDMAASARAAGPLLDLGRQAMAFAGTGDPTVAAKALSDWRASFEREAAEAPLLAAKKDARRVAAFVAFAKAAGLAPSAAWKDAAAGAVVSNVAEPWASMSLDQLEAAAGAKFAGPSLSHSITPSTKQAAGVELTDEDIEVARLTGMSIDNFKAHKAELRARDAGGI